MRHPPKAGETKSADPALWLKQHTLPTKAEISAQKRILTCSIYKPRTNVRNDCKYRSSAGNNHIAWVRYHNYRARPYKI